MPNTSLERDPLVQPAEITRVLEHAEKLVAAGDFRQAIDYATAANRNLRAPELERRLMVWRANAYPSVQHETGATPWPQQFADPFPGQSGPPEIDAADLTVERMGGAFQHHGSLLVRGMIASHEAEHLRTGIDRAMRARDAFQSGTPVEELDAWYAETPLDTPTATARGWVGSLWTADSPRMMYEVLELYERHGLTAVISGYLRESLMLSIGKSTLRRVDPGGGEHDWHQDGAFLGKDVRTVNVWLSLSDCGVDAPGIDVVAQRLPGVVETGSHGAIFDWSVGRGVVEGLKQEGARVVCPVFRPGDVMLFDQLMLHRTAVRPEMTKSRYAIESWYFTPSTFPMDQGPLLV
jgi:hypothetical protein